MEQSTKMREVAQEISYLMFTTMFILQTWSRNSNRDYRRAGGGGQQCVEGSWIQGSMARILWWLNALQKMCNYKGCEWMATS